MGRPSKWSPEFREEAVRMYRESEESIAAVARRLGLGPETFRRWVREDEVERGQRDGTTREEHAEIVKLRREVRRLEEEKLMVLAAETEVLGRAYELLHGQLQPGMTEQEIAKRFAIAQLEAGAHE